jgi:hypothetical protein
MMCYLLRVGRVRQPNLTRVAKYFLRKQKEPILQTADAHQAQFEFLEQWLCGKLRAFQQL